MIQVRIGMSRKMHQQINVFSGTHLGRPLWRHLADLGVPFWRPLDFEGSVRSVFRDAFGAGTTVKQIMYFVTTVLLKLGNAQQRKT